MSVIVDRPERLIRINRVIEGFYGPGPIQQPTREAVTAALSAAYEAQQAAYCHTYCPGPCTAHQVRRLADDLSPHGRTSSPRRSTRHQGLRETAQHITVVLYNTVANDGTEFLDPAHHVTLLRARGDIWEHCARRRRTR
jgi:hypothetical protein